MELIAAVVGAFFLFLLGFPLIGACVGFFLLILFPYLFGGILIYLAMAQLFTPTGAWWEYALPLLAWAILIFGTRQIDRRYHAWHQGHWRAVLLAVTFGVWRYARLKSNVVEQLEYRSAVGL